MTYVAKKKNCYNCKYLDYYSAYYEESSESGYHCNGRNYKTTDDENKHLTQLNCQPKYLEASKKCCELAIK